MASSAHKFSQEQIEAVFALGDVNDDGAIDLEEFIGVMCPSAEIVISRITQRFNNINEVKKSFMSIDVDHDGQITRQEMTSSGKFNPQEVDAIFILGDVNGDGNIDLEEFIGLMCPTAVEAISKMTKSVRNISEAQQLFRILDKNGDGMISMEEMRNCGQQFSAKEIDAIFALGDVNNDGEIDVSEFVAVMCPSASTVVARISKGFKTLEDVKQAFKKIDKDGDGNISKKELASCGLNDQQVEAIFALGDTNGDGQIDLQEFISCMCPSASAVVFKVSKLFNSKEKAAEAFKKIDINGDGKISKDEMRSATLYNGTKLNPIEVDSIFSLGDANGDGEIDLEEFLAVMVPSAGFSSSFSSSSNTTFVKKTTTSSFSSSSSSSFQQMSSTQSYSATTSYSTSSTSTVSVSFSSALDVKKAFRKFDSNGDGHLDRNELKQLLISSGKNVSDQEVAALFAKGDIDGDGMIDIQEFVKLMFPAATATLQKVQQSFKSLNDVKAAFRRFDTDGDGHISRNELRQVMSSFTDSEVDAVFSLGDKDQSGAIDYQEFIAMMMPNSTSILQNVASQFRSIQAVKDGFKRIDTNGDGAISRQELKQGMHLSDQELDVIFALGDIDQDGEISMAEFIPLMSPSAATAMNRLRNSFRDITEVIIAFKKFDSNNDGALSQDELLAGMRSTGLDFDSKECGMVFSMADLNQDGEINYVEFVSALFPAASDGLSKFRGRLGAITDVKMAFKRFDADGDGEISIMELKNGAGSGFSTGEIASVFALGDSNQDGKLSFAEFAQLVLPSAREKVCMLKKSFKGAQEVQAAFQKFDVNKDGKISCEELKNGLNGTGFRFNDQEVQTIFAMADVDGDGEISMEEFSTLLGGGESSSKSQQGSTKSSGSIQFRSIDELKNAFKRFDINSDGHLDRNEFKQLVASCAGGSDAEIDILFKQGDIDGDGKLDYQELIRLLFPQSAQALQKLQKSFSSLNDVKAAFKRYDSDGDGHVSKSELQQVMKGFSSSEVDAVFALGDKDQSGGIDYQEFIALMLPNAPATISRLGMSFRSIGNVKESFKKFDVNKDGQISRTELKNGMKLSDADLDIVFALGDLDGDGEISMSEFVLIMCPLAKNAVNRFRNCFKDIHDLISAFAQFDSNNDGAISQQELSAGMRNMRMSFSNEETNAIFAAADINQDGEIAYTEFVSLMIPTAGDALLKFRKSFGNAANAKAAFSRFDSDGDAEVNFNELKSGMGGNFSENEIKAVFALGDTDQDGSISYLEFAKLMIPSATDVLAKFWKCFRDVKGVRQAFKQFDVDGDGKITKQEVAQGMNKSGRSFTKEDIEILFLLADKDGDGQIDFTEFALILIPTAPERISKLKKKYTTKAAVQAAFKSFDTNNDGAIDSKELANGLKNSGICLTDQEIETIFAVADIDGDGQICSAEFGQLLGVDSVGAPAAAGGANPAAVVAIFRNLYKTIDQVRSAFIQYDVDGDRNISRAELEQGMVRSGQFTQQESKLVFDIADIDGNGTIDIGEFVQMMFPNAAQLISNLKQNFATEAEVKAAFNSWDSNKDGQISFAELKAAVQRSGQRLNDEDINAIFVVGDIDQNGEIDLGEFMAMMMPTSSDVVAKFRAIRKTVKDVQQSFKQIDRDGNGTIDKQELTAALKSSGGNFTQQDIDTLFAAGDIDGNGEIDYEEFIALMCPSASDIVEKFRSKYKTLNDVRAAFKRFDRNGDGALSKDELSSAMKSSGDSYSEIEVDAIFSLGDVDGDGEITLEEFITLMSPSSSSIVQRLRSSFKNLNDVKAAFKKIDTNKDGLLSKQEVLQSSGNTFDKEEVDSIFALGDVNGDGEIDMGEFISLLFPSAVEVAMQVSATFKTMDDIKRGFKLMDKDGDGTITKQEMTSSGHRFNSAQVEAVFALGDVNDDGVLDLDEFISVMCPSALTVISRLRGKFSNISEVKKAFLAIDVNRDGLLSKQEINSSGKFNPQEVDAIFILGDLNGDGELDLEEFVGLLCPTAGMALSRLTRNVNNINDAQQLFRILDKDGDGNISMEEMRAW